MAETPTIAGSEQLVGVCASAILVLENPRLRFILLLGTAIWAFCRAYYFAFYVIQHYADPNFRYAGLWAFVRYSLSSRKTRGNG